MRIPAACKTAIEEFVPRANFELLPPKDSETSFIFKYGVRVSYTKDGEDRIGWICLTDDECRAAIKSIPLYGEKTSNATTHLKEAHGVHSDKTVAEGDRKCSREEEVEDLKRSPIVARDPKRARLLLETRRIVLNNLPFRFGESHESRVVNDLCLKDEFQQPINHKMVNHAIVELYASTKQEVMRLLRENGAHEVKTLTVVADFWTCKTQHIKYLGLQVFFVSKDWKLKTILLGIRRFEPSFGDRDTGIRRPFRRWIDSMLDDFDLSTNNLFGGMSDAGSDVKWMLQSGLGLQWEWCLAHLSNAATKMACGLVNNRKDSKNPEMTDLIERVCKVVRQVRDVEVMGDLFKALCEMEGADQTTRLLDYKSHRFLGLTSVVKRVSVFLSAGMSW